MDKLSFLCTEDHPLITHGTITGLTRKCLDNCIFVVEERNLLGLGLPRLNAQFADVELAAAPPV